MNLDPKLVSLGKVVFELRQDIDLHRIISLNVDAVRAAQASTVFFGHIQRLALVAIAINFCKVFEAASVRHPLCSIPAILNDLPDGFPQFYNAGQFQKFASKHGGDDTQKSGAAIVRSAYDATRVRYRDALDRLRTFRNKIGAHLEFGAVCESLPSHDTFERLWAFAHDTYYIIHDQYNDIRPAAIPRDMRVALRRTLNQLGIKEPKTDFKRS